MLIEILMSEEIKPTVDEQMQMAMAANALERGVGNTVELDGRVYKLRPISNKIAAKIANLAYDALYLERESKRDNLTAKQAKRINTKMRQVPAKMAAYYNLGRWAHLPFVWRVRWRQLWKRSEEVSAMINAKCATGKDKDFFLANSEVIKYQLALSMRGVGESVKAMLERKESAEGMLDEDALPKKKEADK